MKKCTFAVGFYWNNSVKYPFPLYKAGTLSWEYGVALAAYPLFLIS